MQTPSFSRHGGGLLRCVVGLDLDAADRQIYYPPPPSPLAFDTQITSEAGSLGAWIAPGPGKGALVVFGGNAMSLAAWRDRTGIAGCTDRTLVLAPYRGYEGNPGTPGEQALVADGRRVVDWAQQRYGTVAVLGISLGSGVAAAVAAEKGNRIDRLLLGTPYDSLAEVAHDLMPWLWPRLLLRDTYDSYARAKQITVPVWVLRAKNDQLIGAARTQRLLTGFKADIPVQETVIDGTHESGWRTDAACQWLKSASAIKHEGKSDTDTATTVLIGAATR